ncbi:hypothetical protein E2320_000304, partial [Naja naja]
SPAPFLRHRKRLPHPATPWRLGHHRVPQSSCPPWKTAVSQCCSPHTSLWLSPTSSSDLARAVSFCSDPEAMPSASPRKCFFVPSARAAGVVAAAMKPILLQGHERSITQIKYNREGDLLFTVAKDPTVNVWYSVNGERLGTYTGHTGAVWCVDADWDTRHVLTGSADNSCRLWDCETGKQLALVKTNSAVRTCGFDFGGNIIMFSTDKQMGYQCFVSFFDLRDSSQLEDNEPYMKIPCSESKITSAVWGPLGEFIIVGHENGELNQFSAKLFDSTNLDHLKTFRTERPVNSAALSPIFDHVVLGGGQEAMDVTTTSTRIGKFEARFFHLGVEEEFGRVKGHFGPINSVAFHPDGKSYSSGGEDGYVRIHYFDPQYFEFEFEV